MSDILFIVGKYVKDLLNYDENLIIIGKENYERANFQDNLIVVDFTSLIPIGTPYSYDGDAENESICIKMIGDFTLDFYGDNARDTAILFNGLKLSQSGYELARDANIEVFDFNQLLNLKELTNNVYTNRFQVQLKIGYTETTIVNTLTIDTFTNTLIFNK